MRLDVVVLLCGCVILLAIGAAVYDYWKEQK
jgi:hypothetical protein